MKNPLQNLSKGVKSLFNLVVKGESLQDTARKPDAIAALVAASAPSFAGSGEEDYAKTPAAALKRIRTKDLETLVEHKVAVGLDPRLGEQGLTTREKPVNAVYYSRGKSGGTLALPDFRDGFSLQRA
ncbi:MAG TPA: hypothetical protein VEF76_07295 [Patescibacteria group bacterium]|nr:hypothetical protein [Patescibacteria group bacterium]